ncbi:hypothetical protein DX932_29935 [Bacillus cereus]|uniref:Uncharacterized protein n=1 Tax=Bacillus cereus TaxID=1396 RepID=A0A9W7PZS5_BACCE|nr:hypothetical protein DX932_29935 [Bacillus cereus]
MGRDWKRVTTDTAPVFYPTRRKRKRRRKRSIGWQRWSNEYLYGVLGLYWDWKVLPLKSAESFR